MEIDKLTKEVECHIDKIVEDGFDYQNIDLLGKLVDIHKDLANEEYWKIKEEGIEMNYRPYDMDYRNYGRESYGRRRDSRGRYMERGTRRNDNRGEEMLDEMHEHYRRYSDGREEMSRGNYGTHSDTMKSLEYMLESVVDFIEMLKKDANTEEEMDLIREYSHKISEM